jgi:hypothetical protein
MSVREAATAFVCSDNAPDKAAGNSAGCVGQVAGLIHAPDLIRGQARDIGKEAGQGLSAFSLCDGCPVNGKRSTVAIAAVE